MSSNRAHLILMEMRAGGKGFVAAIFSPILIGFVFLAILWVLNAILVIIAAIQASEGKFYRYPMTIRSIQ